METVITAKLSLNVSAEELKLLEAVSCAYRDACNHVSSIAFYEKEYNAVNLQKMSYAVLRDRFALKAQMAISVTRTVAARYTKENRIKLDKPVFFSLPQCDQVRGRDWSIDIEKGIVSLNTLEKRIKVPFSSKGFEKYINKDAVYGGAKLVFKKGKAFFHVSVTLSSPDFIADEKKVVGVDRGIINTAVSYDGKKTRFYKGKEVKEKRAKFKAVRQSLQKRNTPSSRRRLKAIGRRENRYVSDVNHQLAKTLVTGNERGTVFVLEDLSGVRNATCRVRRKERYISVSWPYYDLQRKLEYKASLAGCSVIYVDARHTSQTCPHCLNVDKNARDRRKRLYSCPVCGYKGNDDRIAAMNIYKRGLEKIRQTG